MWADVVRILNSRPCMHLICSLHEEKSVDWLRCRTGRKFCQIHKSTSNQMPAFVKPTIPHFNTKKAHVYSQQSSRWALVDKTLKIDNRVRPIFHQTYLQQLNTIGCLTSTIAIIPIYQIHPHCWVGHCPRGGKTYFVERRSIFLLTGYNRDLQSEYTTFGTRLRSLTFRLTIPAPMTGRPDSSGVVVGEMV